MRKLIIFIFIGLLLLLTGCEKGWPRITYDHSSWTFYNEVIQLKDGYIINEGHMYDIVETEDGYDLVLHFVEETE